MQRAFSVLLDVTSNNKRHHSNLTQCIGVISKEYRIVLNIKVILV